MARIQILELPQVVSERGVASTPFVVVIDHVTKSEWSGSWGRPDEGELDSFREQIGAASILVSHSSVDLV